MNHTKEEYNRKIKRWQLWINETKPSENNTYRWRWIRDSTSLEIIFLKIECGYLITSIRTQYRISKDKDYSFVEFDIRPIRRMSINVNNNNAHGPKFRNLPQFHSTIYQKLATTLKIWMRDERIRHLLNPVCEHVLSKRNNETLSSFHPKRNVYFGLRCNKCDTYDLTMD
jgi:hypothetical protein